MRHSLRKREGWKQVFSADCIQNRKIELMEDQTHLRLAHK
jgi:hypothetical protein